MRGLNRSKFPVSITCCLCKGCAWCWIWSCTMGTSDKLQSEPKLKSNLKHPGWSWAPSTAAAATFLCSSQKADKLLGVLRVNAQLQIREDLLFYPRVRMKSFLHWKQQESWLSSPEELPTRSILSCRTVWGWKDISHFQSRITRLSRCVVGKNLTPLIAK